MYIFGLVKENKRCIYYIIDLCNVLSHSCAVEWQTVCSLVCLNTF